ncbi:MAG: hypothetical protein HY289_05360, partial [Planctomycetes bacterium]|nr:hypothetical protein [Planctomycetota bacterium]
QWVKTDDGYRLEGTSRALRLPPKTYGWAWITGCVLGGLVIAGGAFAIYRRTLAARPTAGGSSP